MNTVNSAERPDSQLITPAPKEDVYAPKRINILRAKVISNLSASFFIALDYFLALILAHFDEKCTVYREFY